VRLVPASPAERDAKLIAGEIDGAMGFDATLVFALRALGEKPGDYHLLYYADSGLDVYSSTVMASRDWLARDPVAGRGLVRAVNRGRGGAATRPVGRQGHRPRPPAVGHRPPAAHAVGCAAGAGRHGSGANRAQRRHRDGT
jgi:hypothetical protein